MTVAADTTIARQLPPPAGRRVLDDAGFPMPKDERWLYTPVRDVLERLAAADGDHVEAHRPLPSTADIDELAGHHGANRLVFVNGRHVPELSDVVTGVGWWCGALRDLPVALEADLEAIQLRSGELETSGGFDGLNRTGAHDVAVVIAGPGVVVGEAVHVVHLHDPGVSPGISNPRTIVRAADGSGLDVVESYVGLPGRGFTNASTFVSVGRNAEVSHRRIETEPTTSVHIGRTMFDQAERSRVSTTSITLGAEIVHHAIDIVQNGPYAVTAVDGLYMPIGHQCHDTIVTVDHAASHGISTERVSGVIDDEARGAFTGHVVVRPGTAANDARQSNRNLLLSPRAQVDTRPWLEILADDVQCTHGATVGRLDAEAMFYLRSRGIPHATARSMLVDAFVAEIVDDISPTSLRDHVQSVITSRRPERRS